MMQKNSRGSDKVYELIMFRLTALNLDQRNRQEMNYHHTFISNFLYFISFGERKQTKRAS